MNIIRLVLYEFIVIVFIFLFAWAFTFLDAIFLLKSFQAEWSIITGIAILLLGVTLRFWAALIFYTGGIEFLALAAQQNIVKKAPFSFSRNPLMLSNILIALAIVLIVGSITGFVIPLIVFMVSHLWVVFYEEKNLEKKFGKEYLDYKKEVRRWL